MECLSDIDFLRGNCLLPVHYIECLDHLQKVTPHCVLLDLVYRIFVIHSEGLLSYSVVFESLKGPEECLMVVSSF